MQSCAVAHDFWRQEPSFDLLHDDEDAQHETTDEDAPTWLKQRDGNGDCQADDASKEWNDIEKSEHEADDQAVTEAYEAKAGGKQ